MGDSPLGRLPRQDSAPGPPPQSWEKSPPPQKAQPCQENSAPKPPHRAGPGLGQSNYNLGGDALEAPRHSVSPNLLPAPQSLGQGGVEVYLL